MCVDGGGVAFNGFGSLVTTGAQHSLNTSDISLTYFTDT